VSKTAGRVDAKLLTAALIIQRTWRKVLARRRLRLAIQEAYKTEVATKIRLTSAMRGYRTRAAQKPAIQQLKLTRSFNYFTCLRQELETDAGQKIARCWRQHKQRRQQLIERHLGKKAPGPYKGSLDLDGADMPGLTPMRSVPSGGIVKGRLGRRAKPKQRTSMEPPRIRHLQPSDPTQNQSVELSPIGESDD
jgi:hypothetical protein